MPPELTNIWNVVLVYNIEAALRWLAEFTKSAGLATILFTIVVRTAMLPLSRQQIKSQRAMATIQPKLAELKKQFAGDRARQGQEQIRLYKEAGVNPMAGCLPMLIQMPIWIALYSSLQNLSRNDPAFQSQFLWIPNLGMASMPHFEDASTWGLVILPIITAITQWIVQKMSTMPTTDQQQQQMNRMMEFMPLMFLYFSFSVPAGLTLYWVTSNVYSIVQQRIFVGWGSLPFLGSGAPLSAPSTAGGATTAISPPRDSGPPPARRKTTTRKRKGK